MHKDVLFRGCTRPAMMMGVPYLPFFLGAGSCLLLALYVNMFFLLAAPLVIAVMRQMARRDEMIFRLLGLRWAIRSRVRNVQHHAGMWVFTANDRGRRKKR
jgi:type IV secretion system protein VirB3